MTVVRGFVGAALLLACTVPACTTNHDGLAAQIDPGGAGGTKAAGSGGVGTGGGYVVPPDGQAPSSGGAPTAVDGGPTDNGPKTLTFLHGVVDSPWVAFCFASTGANGAPVFAGAPVPSGGLDYGHSFAVSAIGGVPVGTADLRPYLVAAASSSVVGAASCAALVANGSHVTASAVRHAELADASFTGPLDATTSLDASSDAASDAAKLDGGHEDAATNSDAGPVPIPDVRITALPLVPTAAFAASRSYLLALGGCIGGPGVSDPSQQSVCGEGYAPDNPSLTEIVVELSRVTRSGHVGVSLLGASPALRFSTLVLVPASPGDAIAVAENVGTGALRPVSPDTANVASDFTTGAPTAQIQLSTEGSADVIYGKPWAPTLVAGGLTGLENGRNYTLVVVGPYPGFAARRWWNDPLVTIVANEAAVPQ
jgi:hypothetical protein